TPPRPHRSAATASSTPAAAPDHVFRLTDEPPACTTRSPTAAATRSNSSRSCASVSTASTPDELVAVLRMLLVIYLPCGAVTLGHQSQIRICGERRGCAQRCPTGVQPARIGRGSATRGRWGRARKPLRKKTPQKGRPPPA